MMFAGFDLIGGEIKFSESPESKQLSQTQDGIEVKRIILDPQTNYANIPF